MPTQTATTPTFRDTIPVGSDFVGGTEFLPVQPTAPGPAVPGSDFAGGTSPLTDEDEHGEPSGSAFGQGADPTLARRLPTT